MRAPTGGFSGLPWPVVIKGRAGPSPPAGVTSAANRVDRRNKRIIKAVEKKR